MKINLKKLLVFLSLSIIVFFVITVANQLIVFSDLIGRYNEAVGEIAFYSFSILLVALIFLPIAYYWKLPEQLKYPKTNSELELINYRKKLCAQLNRNSYIKNEGLIVDESNLEQSLAILDATARKEIRSTASVIFVSTAVSQSGKLDSFLVLFLLVKLVWKIALIYNQRPSATNLVHLYSNVAVTTLIASSVEELDIAAQLEPVLGELMTSSAVGAVPGFSSFSTIAMTSLMDGSMNAFLGLRIGEVAIAYSSCLNKPETKGIRKSATYKALEQLPDVIIENGKVVLNAFMSAGGNKIRNIFRRKANV